MNYNSYQEAYDALVKDNDGVLPDLYELANLTISCHPSNSAAELTVADVVAHALVEMSTRVPARPAIIREPLAKLSTPASPLIDLDKLLARAVGALN